MLVHCHFFCVSLVLDSISKSLFDFLIITPILSIFIGWLTLLLAFIPPLVSYLPNLLIFLRPLKPQQLIFFCLLCSIKRLSIPEVLMLMLGLFISLQEETRNFLVLRDVRGSSSGWLGEQEKETKDRMMCRVDGRVGLLFFVKSSRCLERHIQKSFLEII